MDDYIKNRQFQGSQEDRSLYNLRLDAIVRNFDVGWLQINDGNPLQILWNNKDFLSTFELVNFGDAIKNFEEIDLMWLKGQVKIIKSNDEGNCAGAIFELLGLNLFVNSTCKVRPSAGSNPGFDGVVELSNGSTFLVSVKNHGMTSYERVFQNNAESVDAQFTQWLKQNRQSGYELRIFSGKWIDADTWSKIRRDIKLILDGQINGTAKLQRASGKYSIILKRLSDEYFPLGIYNVSSCFVISGKEHKNEQDKFLDDIRKGCSNLVKHTLRAPAQACPVLFVRLGSTASIDNCVKWAEDYFKQFPDERIGLIILYQSAPIHGKNTTTLSHYLKFIRGPYYNHWVQAMGETTVKLPNLTVLIGGILISAPRKIFQADDNPVQLDSMYSYQRGDIYRSYRFKLNTMYNLSNPAPGILVHSEIERSDGALTIEMITSRRGELILLP